MSGFKTIVNPTTGKMETVDDTTTDAIAEKLNQTKKSLRDMIAGNVQFHEDKLGPDKPEPAPVPAADTTWYWGQSKVE